MRTPNNNAVSRARALARLLDTAIGIPGTRIRVGLDAILGLLPGGGDAVGALLSGYIVLAAARSGASRPVLLRMLGNIVMDTTIGAIPVVGDLFDVYFKSNVRNAALLERLSTEPAALDRASRGLGVAVAIALALVVLALATLGFLLARFLWRLIAES